MDRTARRYVVSGRVQGVGFRWYVARAARELGVTGWVKNLADGRVEVYAAGARERLDELAAYIAQGPPRADVRGYEEKEASLERGAWDGGFDVR